MGHQQGDRPHRIRWADPLQDAAEMVKQRNDTYLRRSIAELNSAEEHYMRDNDQVVKKFKEAKARSTFQDRKGS
jgi:hypothetical protein